MENKSSLAREVLDEMAFTRKKAMEVLDGLQMPIALHLIKVFLLPQHQDFNRWMKELNTWRDTLVKKNLGKKGKNNFNLKNLTNGIWEEPLGEPRDRDRRLLELSRVDFEFKSGIETQLKKFKTLVLSFVDSVLNDTKFGG